MAANSAEYGWLPDDGAPGALKTHAKRPSDIGNLVRVQCCKRGVAWEIRSCVCTTRSVCVCVCVCVCLPSPASE
jgi:hypothetical protein